MLKACHQPNFFLTLSCALATLAAWPVVAVCQAPVHEPRFVIGLRGGEFRVSLDRFEEVYGSRWGLCYGSDASLRVWGNVYAFAGGRFFQTDGGRQVSPHSVDQPTEARWREQWLLVGIRRWSFGERRWSSAVGLGYAFFWVQENPERAALRVPAGGGGEQSGRGFFLSVSLDYSLRQWLGVSAEVEVTSAGVGGRTGFEGSSIGGFFFSLGMNLRPL
ncbi:MAG: hypothetical protein ONB07_06760 [candidate division KSB1 bacterium]|nr:hypothetical protein [candidate division KSB1 bacterium]MDZ7385809.1 hypothetical protein [candidate division KSB1 bacterium]MDZ7392499.1 hypothetical protein [candidate division KSB1 bacterium]